MIRKFASGINAANVRLSYLSRIALACLIWGMGIGSAKGADLLYVTLANNTIEKYDVSLSTALAIQNSRSVFVNNNLVDPYGLSFDSSGNLYAVNYGANSVSKYNSLGVYQSSISTNMSLPAGIAFDRSNNVYVTNHGGSFISVFNANGSYKSSISGNMNLPHGIALDSSGNIFAANWGSTSVTKFNSSGVFQSYISGNISRPIGLAFSNAGKLYVASRFTASIAVFDSNGSYLSSITGNIPSPTGITFDTFGNFYVSNAGNNTITKFDQFGVFQFTWNTSSSPRYLAIPSIVPEPSTYALGLIATVVLALLARRKAVRRRVAA